MENTLTGKVTQILDEQSGTGKNGPWRKQEFILETEGKYAKPVCIAQWGDDIDSFAVQEGERLTAHVDIQSREYNGRWYTDVKAWRVTRDAAAGQDAPPPTGDEPWPDETADPDDGGDDGLPF
ncbi:MAG TPA: DUF3127 domain-containing protein [Longimicrobiales bacterium]|nr:DUF3127 domain-containing protein [Longimicrobiales bacterium]